MRVLCRYFISHADEIRNLSALVSDYDDDRDHDVRSTGMGATTEFHIVCALL